MSTVFITGASRGLGLEFARQYAADGWHVIACCRNPSSAEALQALAKSNPKIQIEAVDVADDASIKTLAAKFKDATFDLLINNAGIYSGADGGGVDKHSNAQTFGTIDSAAWAKVFRTNTIAPLMIAQNFAPLVARCSTGKIINITSKMGSLTEMGNDFVAYRSSKAALNAAMLACVQDLKQLGITVANLHPGWVQTDMGGKSAPLAPEKSISCMRRVIAGLTMKNTGQFLDFDGKVLPW